MKRHIENVRALVFLSAVTLFIAAWSVWAPMPLTAAQGPFMEGAGAGSLVDPQLANYIWLSWFVLYTLAHLLAFTLSGLARYLFIVAFGFSIVLPIVDGLSVGSPWTNTIWALHVAIATFAIGMLFFSPAVIARTRKI